MSILLEKKQIDPFYYEFIFSSQATELIDPFLDETVALFRAENYETAIITERKDENFMVSCIAIKPATEKKQAQSVSEKAQDKLKDKLQLQSTAVSEHAPLSVSFGKVKPLKKSTQPKP